MAIGYISLNFGERIRLELRFAKQMRYKATELIDFTLGAGRNF